MEALPFHERVILVGHSYGGYAISQAMEYLGRTKQNMELSKKQFMLISFIIILSSLGIESTKKPPQTGKHFVLIHGDALELGLGTSLRHC